MSTANVSRSKSICELNIQSLENGDEVRFTAIYAPSSMHGDMLYSPMCKDNRILTYGYDLARGEVSRRFHSEIVSEAMHVSTIEYMIDVAGVIERDDVGEWLRAETVFSYQKIK